MLTTSTFLLSTMAGGWPGSQAEYTRVPFADVNTLKVPDFLPDAKLLLLSDVIPTGWHGNELSNVQQRSSVAVWGAGPVGNMAGQRTLTTSSSLILLPSALTDPLPMRVSAAHVRQPTWRATSAVRTMWCPSTTTRSGWRRRRATAATRSTSTRWMSSQS